MASSELDIIIDNNDPALTFSPAWAFSIPDPIWYNDSYSYFPNGQGNATIRYDFQGTSLALFGHSNGEVWANVDTNPQVYTPPEPTFQIFRPWYTSGSLTDGQHTVHVELSTMTYFDFATVSVGQGTSLAGKTVIVDDADAAMNFSTGWKAEDGASNFDLGNGMRRQPYKQTLHRSRTPGDELVLQFTGSSVAVYGVVQWQYPGRLSTAYIIDGSAPQYNTVSSSGDSYTWEEQPNYLFFQNSSLPPGNHTLVVTVTEASDELSFILDYLLYNPSFPNLSSKPHLTANDIHAWTRPPLILPPRRVPVGAIVGAVVGGVFLLAITLFVFWRFWWRKRKPPARARRPRVEIDPTPATIEYPSPRDPFPLAAYHLAPSSSDLPSSDTRSSSHPERPLPTSDWSPSPTHHHEHTTSSITGTTLSSPDPSDSIAGTQSSPRAQLPYRLRNPSSPPSTGYSEKSSLSYHTAMSGSPASPVSVPQAAYEYLRQRDATKAGRRPSTEPSPSLPGDDVRQGESAMRKTSYGGEMRSVASEDGSPGGVVEVPPVYGPRAVLRRETP
ncbi:hypothetical protein HGRIS_003193 [Hohenbuehelia grisea]|uniref:Transmembrane protein n=1 Tax=Hohenbuehelia grisea TaxID=104357 RepID=A0ABR3JPK9_9AGAR